MNLPKATFFIIPGFKQQATDKDFVWLVAYLKKNKFNIVPVSIQWDYRIMSDYINDFKRCYEDHRTITNYVLGFSYGAVIAFSTASQLRPNKVFLCSLSPDFKEDMSSQKT